MIHPSCFSASHIALKAKELSQADPLTAFAPRTLGVPLRNRDGSPGRTMQVAKKLFDVGELFAVTAGRTALLAGLLLRNVKGALADHRYTEERFARVESAPITGRLAVLNKLKRSVAGGRLLLAPRGGIPAMTDDR